MRIHAHRLRSFRPCRWQFVGRQALTVNSLGVETVTAYDANGNVVSEEGATYPVRYAYDSQNRRVAMWTSRGSNIWDVTRWVYDPVTGLCTAKTYADGSSVTYEYSSDGLLETTRYASGHWIRNVYDEKRQLVAVNYDDTGEAAYVRDAFGRETSAANSLASYQYLLDKGGIATNESVVITGTRYEIRRDLDDQGRLVSFQMEDSGQTSILNFDYRANGRFGLASNDEVTVTYAYSDDGLDIGSTLTVAGGATFVRSLTRDPYCRDLVTGVANSIGTDFAYTYDALTRPTTRNVDTFAYNARSEVVSAVFARPGEPLAMSFAYDGIGNATVATENAVTNLYAANSLNQYVSVNANGRSFAPTYDADGNLTSFGSLSCQYDSALRLSKVYTNGALYAANYYDHMGRRVRLVARDFTHTFVYDGWNIALEVAEHHGVTNRIEYFWGKDVSGAIGGAGGTGGLLYLKRNGEIYVPIYDACGDIVEYRAADGTLVASYRYDAFGRIIAQSGPMSHLFRFRHATKCFDWQTGIYYYDRCYYIPQLRRWLNRDPLEEQGGLNLYAFCHNNALVFLDKDGQAFFAVRKLEDNVVNNFADWLTRSGLANDFARKHNWEARHEHLFFQDGKQPSDIGWGDDEEDPGKGEFMHDGGFLPEYYTQRDGGYDDCVMREAVAKVGRPSHYGVFSYNCQDYADALRAKYWVLMNDPVVICKCKCSR